MHRRNFLGWTSKAIVLSSAVTALPSLARAQGRPGVPPVRLGLAGYGIRGTELARLAGGAGGGGGGAGGGVQIVAVADAYDGRLARAKEQLGAAIATARDGRALLERPDVDALLIATPDHLHAPLAAAAAAAGKDVYCEGPVAHRPADATVLMKAFAGGSRVFQGGAGIATSPMFQAAKRFIGEGRIGRVTMAAGTWDSGSASDAWAYGYPPDTSAESIDFAAFTGGAAARAFDAARFFRWPCFWDYGSGLAGMRAAPQLAAAHWLLDLTAPQRVVAGGGLLRWKDGREVPDLLVATLDYDGVTVSLSASQNGTGRPCELRLIGTDGTIVIGERQMVVLPEPEAEPYPRIGETFAKPQRDWFYMIHGMSPQGRLRGIPSLEKRAERYELPEAASTESAHLAAFVDAVRTREASVEPLEASLQVARATQLVALASRRGGTAVTPADLTKEGQAA